MVKFYGYFYVEFVVYLPADAFIHIEDFPTLEKLGEHVNYLLANSTAYMKYFDWKKTFEPPKQLLGVCSILKEIFARRNGESTKQFPVVQNLQDFWYEKGKCNKYVRK